ncbi:MAG: hypothetical protein ACFWTK_04175 [Clostridium sp.]|jgi:hypothetical protein
MKNKIKEVLEDITFMGLGVIVGTFLKNLLIMR